MDTLITRAIYRLDAAINALRDEQAGTEAWKTAWINVSNAQYNLKRLMRSLR